MIPASASETARRLQIGRTEVRPRLESKTMKKPKKDPVREDRIHNEAIVDANGPEEQVMGGITTWMTKSGSLFQPSASFPKSFHRSGKAKLSKFSAWHRQMPALVTCSC